MSSTDLGAPPLKSILLAIVAVVGLHVLAAVALAMVKPPEIKPEPKKETPPIEIKLVTPPPPPPPVEIEEINLKEAPEPVREVKPKPKPKAKPVASPKPKVVQKKQPVDKPKAKQAEKPKPAEFTPPPAKQKTTPQKTRKTQVADDQLKILAAQAEQARRDALLAQQQAQAIKDAAAAKKAQEIANAKAAADAAAAQAAKDAEAAAAASNEPVTFSSAAARWKSTPYFDFPKNAQSKAKRFGKPGDKITVLLKVKVNKQGRVDDVSIAKSSGVSALDSNASRKMNGAEFHPFMQNNVAVVGLVTLPVNYIIP
ncbi:MULTISPECIES: energy transducer TonB [unclassified Psychrobacter]|uniref:energy transducer TonB n=1 Tax=unclassified Psychrobacter TaxID=196806 RepID=UPI0025B5C50F|nr:MULTISPECIES: energy transducer TonB [unclassified Psychrobacter]MDN3453303.1 TonB family protein [Psychrobacter sp. APC 3350]MDN3501595.1 TonB family protein [Psychrobacter sp. 5A.1]